MDELAQELVAMFAVIGCGLAIGKIQYKGVALGTSGVVFVALIAGHFGFQVPRIAGVAGVVLFAYCLGLGAGPSFLPMLMHRGRSLGILAIVMLASAAAVAWLAAQTLGLNADLASGILAGAMTSTPALAAASERLSPDSEIAVGFGVAYPVGVVGVILFVQLAPRIMRASESTTREQHDADTATNPIKRVLVRVKNPSVVGKRLRDVAILAHTNCQVSRQFVDGKMKPIPAAFHLELGQDLLVVCTEQGLAEVIEVLGERCTDVNYVLDIEKERRHVVVTSPKVVGRTLQELHLLSRFGVTISRITRQDVQFVPSTRDRIQFGDALTAIGDAAGLEQFVEFAGHRERTLMETDLISLAFGLVAGILCGSIEFTFSGSSLSLGMAGGPLLVGLTLGHLRRLGTFVARMPQPARMLLSEIGLAFFLAQAGSQAGETFVAVIRAQGLALLVAALAIVVIPLCLGLVIAHYGLRLRTLESIGGICGAMTSTPGLGAVVSSTDSSLPATSYATVYPLALIVATMLAPLLISLLS